MYTAFIILMIASSYRFPIHGAIPDHWFMDYPTPILLFSLLVVCGASLFDADVKSGTTGNEKGAASEKTGLLGVDAGALRLTALSFFVGFLYGCLGLIRHAVNWFSADAGWSTLGRLRGNFAEDGDPFIAYHQLGLAMVALLGWDVLSPVVCCTGSAQQKRGWLALWFLFGFLLVVMLNITHPWHRNPSILDFPTLPLLIYGGCLGVVAWADTDVRGKVKDKSDNTWRKYL